jgi:hypothetical protein
MRCSRILMACLLAVCGLLPIGCATGNRLYVNPQADPGAYTKIALMPFGNLTADRFAPERVSRALESALLTTERYSIMGAGEFYPLLQKGGVDPNRLAADPDKLKAVTSAVGVTGILRGVVTEYRSQRTSGQEEYPLLAFDAELVDGPTGTVVWRTSVTARGHSSLALLGMSGDRSFTQVTEKACAQAVAALKSKGF